MSNGTISALTDVAVIGFTVGAVTLALDALKGKGKDKVNFFR